MKRVEQCRADCTLPGKHLLNAMERTVNEDGRAEEWLESLLNTVARVRTRLDANRLLEQNQMLFLPGGLIKKFAKDLFYGASKEYYKFRGERRENNIVVKTMKQELKESKLSQIEEGRAVAKKRLSQKEMKAQRRKDKFPERVKSRQRRGLIQEAQVPLRLSDLKEFRDNLKKGTVNSTICCDTSIKHGVERAVEMYNGARGALEKWEPKHITLYKPKHIREIELHRARLDAQGEAVELEGQDKSQFVTHKRSKPLKERGMRKMRAKKRLVGIELNPGPHRRRQRDGENPPRRNHPRIDVPGRVPPSTYHEPGKMRQEMVVEAVEKREETGITLPQSAAGHEIQNEPSLKTSENPLFPKQPSEDELPDFGMHESDHLRWSWVTNTPTVNDLQEGRALPKECLDWLDFRTDEIRKRPGSLSWLRIALLGLGVGTTALLLRKRHAASIPTGILTMSMFMMGAGPQPMALSYDGLHGTTYEQEAREQDCYLWRVSLICQKMGNNDEKRGPSDREYPMRNPVCMGRLRVECLHYTRFVLKDVCPVSLVFEGPVDMLTALDSYSYQLDARDEDVIRYSHFTYRAARGVNRTLMDDALRGGSEWWIYLAKRLDTKYRNSSLLHLFQLRGGVRVPTTSMATL